MTRGGKGRVALVAGATGLVGSLCVRQLREQTEYRSVKALVRRRPQEAVAGVDYLVTDFSDLGALAGQLACDDVFCCLGTTLRRAGSKPAFERVDYHMVVDLARAARKAGARRFVLVSAAGASLRSPAFYSRVKARTERAVSDLGYDAVHIVRPSLLLGQREEFRPIEWLTQRVAPLLSPFLRGPLARYRPDRAEDVAAALVYLALHGEAGVHVHHLPLL